MVVFNFSHNNYHTLLHDFAKQLKVIPVNNSLQIPADIGEGIIKVLQLPNGLQVLLVKIFFKKDAQIISGNTDHGDYVLNFDEVEMAEEKQNISAKNINSFVRLTGESFKHFDIIKKNTSVQYIKILFSKVWLTKYIGLREKMSTFEKFIPVKSGAAEKQKLNEEYQRIITEIWEVSVDDPLHNIYYNNRILLLIEQFFTKMHAEMLNPKGTHKLTADNIVKLKKVEAALRSPGKSPLNIDKLAQKVSLTKPKLSLLFKQVYGTSIYNYYQKQRMQKAHQLLSTKKYTVKEVGEKLGYTNLSNFVLVFTRQFNTAPKSLLD